MRAWATPILALLFVDDVSLLWLPALLVQVVPSLLQVVLQAVLMVLVVPVLAVSVGFLVVLVVPAVGADLVHLPANFQVVRADLLSVPMLANSVLHNLPIG